MTISPRFLCVIAVTLSISGAALSQTTSGPARSTEATPAPTDATGGATTSGIRRNGDSTSHGPRPLESPSQGAKGPSREGIGPDPTAVQEPPSITGNGTAGEGT